MQSLIQRTWQQRSFQRLAVQRAGDSTAQKATVSFRPLPFVRQGHIQTVLGRALPRGIVVRNFEQPVLLDAGHDVTGCDPDGRVRLLGYYTPSLTATGARGLVLLLHGWEGCSHSPTNIVMADSLVRAGYAVFRLNVRDHGPNLHFDRYTLNRGLFLGTLLDEIASATQTVARMAGHRPFYIVGGSMGGNLAMRLALRHAQTPFHNLEHVVAICPALEPAHATDAIDRFAPYRRYFRSQWLHSLLAKEQLYPDLYQFAPIKSIPLIRDMTEWLVRALDLFADADDYFAHYRVAPQDIEPLNVRTTIITAENDAVIPVADIRALPAHPMLDVRIHPTGGHMGFVDVFPVRHWLPGAVLQAIRPL